MIEIVAIDTPELGDRSYLAIDGAVALVVDPQRDIDRVLAAAAARGAAITDVFETHIHNDYISGGLALARQTGAAYHVSAEDDVAFDRDKIADGDEVAAGESMRVRAIATPGHTFTHLSYALEDAGTSQTVAVFTGGSLLYGATGRPDLLGPAHAAALAAAQYASARRLAALIPDGTSVFPTHGFGSFCAAGPSGAGASSSPAGASTIGEERRTNPVLTLDQERYVAGLLASLDVYPAYYARMAPANAAGPGAPDLALPASENAAQISSRIAAGEWVVDLRQRRAFAAGHVRGSLSFEFGDSLTTNLGWLIPWGTPLTLLGDTPDQIAAAQRDLARIGIDQLAGAATGTAGEWAGTGRLASYPVSDFAGLAAALQHQPVTILDVRRPSEWAASHIDGAVHVPLHELPARLHELPRTAIWVHCQAGYRSSIAASLLHAAGHDVTTVDDDYSQAGKAGLPLTGNSASPD